MWSNIYFGFNILMILIYLSAGVFLLIADIAQERMNSSIRIPLGIAIICYGVFRLYRAIRRFKDQSDEDE